MHEMHPSAADFMLCGFLATGNCVRTRQNAEIYALFAKFDFARTTKYEQSRLRQKSSKIAAF